MSMQSIMAASQSMARMQTMQSARTQMQGAANVLRTESKLDGGNKAKDAKADALEQKSSNLMGDLMDEVSDVTKTLKPDEEIKAEEKQEEKSIEKDQRTDKVTFSKHAAGYKEPSPVTHTVVKDAVTYKADGSTAASTPANATPSFDATA